MKETGETASFNVVGLNKRGVIQVPKTVRELYPNWDKDSIFSITITRVELGK